MNLATDVQSSVFVGIDRLAFKQVAQEASKLNTVYSLEAGLSEVRKNIICIIVSLMGSNCSFIDLHIRGDHCDRLIQFK